MKVLLLETSTEKALIALLKEGQIIREKHLPGGSELSKRLALEVSLLLAGETPDQIAVGQGPGSYTGIRVAAALGQGLSLGWDIPLLGFCSLKAFLPTPSHAVLVDARSGGLYTLIAGESKKIPIDDPLLLTLPLLASPHPAQIQKRISLPGKWTETKPQTAHLLSQLSPLQLAY